MVALQIKDLSKSFGITEVLNKINLEIVKGDELEIFSNSSNLATTSSEIEGTLASIWSIIFSLCPDWIVFLTNWNIYLKLQ